MSSEHTMADYARFYDMSQVEINLFYKKDEDDLIEMIEGMFHQETRRLRSLLIDIRKRKTEIKTLRQSLENPVEYFENLVDSIYSESEGNIKSLKVTMKKVKSILSLMKKTQQDLKDAEKIETPIGKVFNNQVDFLTGRMEYYENTMSQFQSYIEYSKNYKDIQKKSFDEFRAKAISYCANLLSLISIEENDLKANEESYKQELEDWRNGLAVFQEQYEKQIIKSLE